MMNKEVILKNREAFNYWLDGGQVWIKINTSWQLFGGGYRWTHNTPTIQNDEYADLRKAQADGKVVQLINTQTKSWVDIDSKHDFVQDKKRFINETEYRIKPDEPKFKVGQWVVDTFKGKTFQITKDICHTYKHDYVKECIELWKPKEGEWFVFWDDDSDYSRYIIAKYRNQPHDSKNTADYGSGYSVSFQNIAPLEYAMTLKGK